MKNEYSIGEFVKNIISLAYTKIFYKNARLIRRPFFVRGKRLMTFAKGLTTGYGCRIEMFDLLSDNKIKLTIGENCKMGDYVHIAAGESIKIGDNCLLASKIYISDITHGDYSISSNASDPRIPPDLRILKSSPVIIGNNVWIGDNVCVLPGVSVGDGSIIGANAVVTKDIPEYCVAVGTPAKIIKRFNFKTLTWNTVV